jgi:large subunit ribosomal protein L12
MEYVYAALLLNAAEKEINEENVAAILSAAGVDADDARIKALIASLEDVDIEEAIATAAVSAAPAAGAAAPAAAEEEEAEEEAAAAGLGALFG